MPQSIEGFLYELEKKILIQEVWDDQEGYGILQEGNNYRGQAFFKRLRLHAIERT